MYQTFFPFLLSSFSSRSLFSSFLLLFLTYLLRFSQTSFPSYAFVFSLFFSLTLYRFVFLCTIIPLPVLHLSFFSPSPKLFLSFPLVYLLPSIPLFTYSHFSSFVPSVFPHILSLHLLSPSPSSLFRLYSFLLFVPFFHFLGIHSLSLAYLPLRPPLFVLFSASFSFPPRLLATFLSFSHYFLSNTHSYRPPSSLAPRDLLLSTSPAQPANFLSPVFFFLPFISNLLLLSSSLSLRALFHITGGSY